MISLAGQSPYRLVSRNFVLAYIVTMRPYLMFVSGITGIVGLAFVANTNFIGTGLIVLASFLSYGFGQALTDCFQTDTDSISAPYRPLTQGIVRRQDFLVVSLCGLAFCVAVFAYHNPSNIFLGILGGGGLATYTPFKRRWWAGPFYNAWIVVVLCLMATNAGTAMRAAVESPAFLSMLLVVFFGYANFILTGYFKDISADRSTGYTTLPVRFGREISACVSDFFALMTIGATVAVFVQNVNAFSSPIALLFTGAGILMMIATQLQLHQVTTDEEAHPAIASCLESYILILSGIACLRRPEWSFPLAIDFLIFLITLKLRPRRSQI